MRNWINFLFHVSNVKFSSSINQRTVKCIKFRWYSSINLNRLFYSRRSFYCRQICALCRCAHKLYRVRTVALNQARASSLRAYEGEMTPATSTRVLATFCTLWLNSFVFLHSADVTGFSATVGDTRTELVQWNPLSVHNVTWLICNLRFWLNLPSHPQIPTHGTCI